MFDICLKYLFQEQENSKMLFPGGSQAGVLKVRHHMPQEKCTKAVRYKTNLSIKFEFIVLQYTVYSTCIGPQGWSCVITYCAVSVNAFTQ